MYISNKISFFSISVHVDNSPLYMMSLLNRKNKDKYRIRFSTSKNWREKLTSTINDKKILKKMRFIILNHNNITEYIQKKWL